MSEKEARLIDANALEKAVEGIKTPVAVAKEKVLRLIKKAPTIDPESPCSRWIRVQDRLPTKEDASENDTVIAVMNDDGFPKLWWYEVILRYPQYFTYWMPFPDTPKEV